MDKYAGDRTALVRDEDHHADLGAPGRSRLGMLWALVWRAALAIAILAAAALWAMQWLAERPDRPQRQARERSFPVAVVEPQRGRFAATITANGQILAAQTMDVRAQIGGVIQDVAPGLVEGGALKMGTVALTIDDFTYKNAVAQAQLAVQDAQTGLDAAKRQLDLNRSARDIARTQVEFATRDLERAKTLAKSGTVSSKATSDLELALEQKKQAVTQQEGAVALQEAAISRQHTALARARIGLEDAQNALANTRIVVPYDARVISANVQPGRVVAPNEVVARLYKADALEVKFSLADAQYGALANALIGKRVKVRWRTGDAEITAQGAIVRTGAEVQTGLGSISVFAQLTSGQTGLLRPGTFVDVELQGVVHEGAYRLPETALYEQDHLFVRNDKGRMQPVPVTLFAYDGEDVIVGTAQPLGAPVITTHLAQAGEGVKVTLEGAEPQLPGARAGRSPEGAANQGANRPADAAPGAAAGTRTRPNGNGGPTRPGNNRPNAPAGAGS